MPSHAFFIRRLPSNVNGLVTTPTVSAPWSRAICEMIGAAPVPVPPPMPAVTNTMSAPSSISAIRLASSSAALRPTSGCAPAPRPRVSEPPSWIFSGARFSASACVSVLAAMNSTPSSPAWIMVFSALPPLPPTPTTLIFACSSASSANSIEIAIACLVCVALAEDAPSTVRVTGKSEDLPEPLADP